MNSARPVSHAAGAVLAKLRKPSGIVDERKVFRGRLVRALRLSAQHGIPHLAYSDLKSIVNQYATYPWHQGEFERMVDAGTLVRSGGPHGDEELYGLGEAA